MSEVKTVETEVRTGTRAAIGRAPYTWLLSALGVGIVLGLATRLLF